MDSTDLEVLKAAARWVEQGHYALLGTVVRTWGSAPRPVGSMMAMRADGRIVGSVSGGCIEDELLEQVSSGRLRPQHPHLVRYGVDAEEAHRFGLPCGGTVEILLEPLSSASRIPALLESVAKRQALRRELDLHTGAVRLFPGAQAGALYLDEHRLVTRHGPRHRLILIGAAQLSRLVADMAHVLDFQVIVCDPRENYLDEWKTEGVELVREMPDDLIQRLHPDANTAIVALTHDPKLDDMALLEALKSDAFYVGAIGSRATQAKRRERLALLGLSEEEIARLRGPVGLYLGARTPQEIAVSVMAEITAVRNGVPILQTHALREQTSPETRPTE